jgi:hypothetical protein
MGHEHDVITYKCGCKHHYSYNEACGMGPIAGTQKEWWEYCSRHLLKANDLKEAITNLEGAIRNMKDELRSIQRDIMAGGYV